MPSTGWPATQTSHRLAPYSLSNSQIMVLKSHCLLCFSRYKEFSGLRALFTHICIFLETSNCLCSKQDPFDMLWNDNSHEIQAIANSRFNDWHIARIKEVSAILSSETLVFSNEFIKRTKRHNFFTTQIREDEKETECWVLARDGGTRAVHPAAGILN